MFDFLRRFNFFEKYEMVELFLTLVGFPVFFLGFFQTLTFRAGHCDSRLEITCFDPFAGVRLICIAALFSLAIGAFQHGRLFSPVVLAELFQ
jgi:hypothetical protein